MIFQGCPDPLTPLWIRTCYLDQQEIAFFPFSRRWVVFFQFYLNFDRPRFCKQTVASGDPTCGSRGGLGVRPSPPPPGKSQVLWVSLDTPTTWKKLDPLLPSVIKPLDPLCKCKISGRRASTPPPPCLTKIPGSAYEPCSTCS